MSNRELHPLSALTEALEDINRLATALEVERTRRKQAEADRTALRAAIVEMHAYVMQTYTEDEATPMHEELLQFLSTVLREINP